MTFIKLIAQLVPKKNKDKLRKMVGYSTIKTEPDTFIGMAITAGIVIAFAFTVFSAKYLAYPPLAKFVAAFVVIQFLIYTWLNLNISSKARTVENALPDALQLMSSNIRAGLTTDKALLMAARPEFGALEEEIRRVGKETMAGRNLIDALARMTLHIRSDDLDRTVELIVHSLKSGGQLADLLDSTANDLRDQQIIKKEISASVLMYVMFIFIAIALGAPALFSMSSFLVELLSNNMAMIAKQMPKDFAAGKSLPIKMGGTSVSGEFIQTYALCSIAASCIMGSMIMGLILKGEEREGFKYMPIMLVIAITLFYAATYILNLTIGGMMPRA